MDIPSPQAGVVREIIVKVGDKVSERSAILVMDVAEGEGAAKPEPAAASKPAAAQPSAAAAKPAPTAKPAPAAEAKPQPAAQPQAPAAPPTAASRGPQPINIPNIGDSRDVDVVEILVKPGDRVEKEQTLIVLESEKASMDIPSPQAGVVREIIVKVGDKVSEGSAILVMDVAAGEGATPTEPAAAKPQAPTAAPPRAAASGPQTRTVPPAPPLTPPPPPPASHLPHASPAVRLFARELGVDLNKVDGSAPRGRITKDDVQGYVKSALTGAKSPAGVGLSVAEAPDIDFSQFGEIEPLPLTKIQRLTGRNLHRSWVTIPHVTQFDEADITELEEFRKKVRKEQPDIKLTLLAFFMKALVPTLQALPRFNSSLDKAGENLILKHYFHIGVAVDTPNGLVVPVIRDVDKKSLGQLAKELEDVSERARSRKLTPGDFQGACITISSLGGIGGTAFTPIINPPEVAVLGVSRARVLPVHRDGAFVPRLMCPLSLSYDHRVIDGAYAARCTTKLAAILGDIRQLLL
jgi:pyruvate dehydrogenase E2 component (dihydrolipoamide acetyltransferase)